jgi:superfamily I DNA/RNA helicase
MSLANKYKNICCVGDDDQSIYAFRGASNKYMLHFKELYPDAQLFTLRENFRSKEEILKAAGRCIAGNKRIKKELVPVRKGGLSPIHVTGQSADELNSVVQTIVAGGTAYDDIAVIASKNATLENLQGQISFPSVLGREFLIDSPLFKAIYWSLCICCGRDIERAKAYLDGIVPDGDAVLQILSVNDPSAMKYCELVAKILGLSETAAFDALCGIIISEHCRSCDSLLEVMQYMNDFGDDTRIEPDTTGQVVFITSHESKGMEWKAVVMIDDYKEEASEEQNRLLYVAMTRAKDILYILDDTRKGNKIAA